MSVSSMRIVFFFQLLPAHLLIGEIAHLNLAFAVCRKRESKSLHYAPRLDLSIT